MGRTKYRTRNAFIGGRKKTSKKREIKEQEDRMEGILLQDDNEPDAQLEMKSASARKLSVFGVDVDIDIKAQSTFQEANDNDCYFFVQKSVLEGLIKKLLCPSCKKPSLGLDLIAESNCGFSTKGKTFCSSCRSFEDKRFFCERFGGSSHTTVPFDINLRSVLAFRGIGSGYSNIKQWCGIMNMPHCLSQGGYTKTLEKIESSSLATFNKISARSRDAIARAYHELGIEPDIDGVLDIAVSFDGSWQKRGHSSHNGVASVIDLVTGFPVDFEVLSNYCNKCKIAEGLPDDVEWKAKHAVNCPKNFDGTANAMEAECAVRLWSRSVARNKLRYTTMLSDGDSKSYDAVVALKPYGDKVRIDKEDCINHVSKRMGTALRNLVATAKAQQQSISGKGKLTDIKIKKIQNFYGRAIKDHSGDIEMLKRRIMAILLHLSSTDNSPKHAHCPPGESSWCFWQRSLAKDQTPGPHRDHETLPPEVGRKLVPVFQRLSETDLLKRCAQSRTQNSNESFHNLIWKICPKATFVGKKTIITAVTLAACQFSMGSSFNRVLCQILHMTPGSFLEQYAAAESVERVKRAEKASKDFIKQRRRHLKFKKIAKQKEKASVEGESYAAGHFGY